MSLRPSSLCSRNAWLWKVGCRFMTVAGTAVRALEDVGYRLWVAPEVEELDGWRLRSARGLTGRANSVLPNAPGTLPVAEKIERAEEGYAERGLPVRFQLTAAALPEGLDDTLAARGYVIPQQP